MLGENLKKFTSNATYKRIVEDKNIIIAMDVTSSLFLCQKIAGKEFKKKSKTN